MNPLFTAALFILVVATRCAAQEDVPGSLLSDTSAPGVLLPYLDRGLQPKDDNLDTRSLIRGLLIRQLTCPSGYGLCSDRSSCCPLGGSCCAGSGCCRAGSFCYSTGCCTDGQLGCAGNSCCSIGENCCSDGGCCSASSYCASVDGIPGCCPIGQVCNLPPNQQCDTAGYVPCPNDSFCCPPGDTCYRDAQNTPRCSASGNPGSPTDSPTTVSVGPTYTPTTDKPSSSSQSSTTSTVSLPMASSLVSNMTVTATDPSIQYSGSWTVVTATCSSSSSAKQCSGSGNTVQYTFVGTAIYLTISQTSDSGLYSITFDDVTVQLDGYTGTAGGCNVTWYKENLSSISRIITITTLGASPLAPSGSTGSFELVNFIVGQQAQSRAQSSTLTVLGFTGSISPAATAPTSAATNLSSSQRTSNPGSQVTGLAALLVLIILLSA